MQSILIVEPDDILREALIREHQKYYQVYSCTHGSEGLALISLHDPDGLILNMCPFGIDGLTLLEHMDKHPRVIMTLSLHYSPPVLQRLMDLNIDFALLIGCPVHAIAQHTRYFMENISATVPPTAQEVTASHLHKLDFPHWGGFDDLRVAVPLFAQAPNQSMVKELYPTVAMFRNRDNWHQVEKAIRNVKEYAYEHRNDAVWQEYFPDTSRCPSNKEFIARLAEFINQYQSGTL